MTAHDHPEYVPGCWRCDLSRDETAHDLPTFTADFETQYDGRTFPFWESEDGDIAGYGHPGKAETAALVRDYWRVVGDQMDDSDPVHRWAVRDDVDGEPAIRWGTPDGPVTESTPGAFPIWTVTL